MLYLLHVANSSPSIWLILCGKVATRPQMDGRSPAAMETEEEEATPELMQTAELVEEAMSDEMRSLAARMREEEEEDAVVAAEDEILAQIEKLVKVITQVKEQMAVGSQEQEAEKRKGKRKLEVEATWTVIPVEEKETVEGNKKIEGGIVKVEAVIAPAWLPPEWLVITRRRKSGRSKGNKDKVWCFSIILVHSSSSPNVLLVHAQHIHSSSFS